MLASKEGKQLFTLLSGDRTALQEAAAAVQRGDTAAAQERLKPLLDNPEAAALLQKIDKKK